jgi:hypothetical protein
MPGAEPGPYVGRIGLRGPEHEAKAVEGMEKSSEPLARRLRYAALERTRGGSERVDDYVLDADGVIDLRELDRVDGDVSIASPAAALASIRGRLGDAAEVSELYDESEPEQRRWTLRRRAGRTDTTDPRPVARTPGHADPAPEPPPPPIPRLSMVPPSRPTAATGSATPDDADSPEGSTATDRAGEAEIDLRGDERPTADCPQCGGSAQRDLFDRFSQVDFFSCDVCSHMWQQDHH